MGRRMKNYLLIVEKKRNKKKPTALSSFAVKYNSGHNLILIETLQIYLTMLQIRVFRMTGDFLSKFKQEGWEIGCLCIMQTIVMRMITQNEVTVSVRPLAFDSSFSDSRCI